MTYNGHPDLGLASGEMLYQMSYFRMDSGTLFRIIKYRNGVPMSKELKGCKNTHYHFCKKILVNLICISGYIRYSPVPEL